MSSSVGLSSAGRIQSRAMRTKRWLAWVWCITCVVVAVVVGCAAVSGDSGELGESGDSAATGLPGRSPDDGKAVAMARILAQNRRLRQASRAEAAPAPEAGAGAANLPAKTAGDGSFSSSTQCLMQFIYKATVTVGNSDFYLSSFAFGDVGVGVGVIYASLCVCTRLVSMAKDAYL